MTDLERIKELIAKVGYRVERDADGTERVIRPDGSVAVIARPKPQP